jgi:pimeloyl-ACP methyl ester carboxylesterase
MISGYVTTEGDDLYYECRGTGQPLLMISGGLGDAGVYTFVADILSDEFKVITYDRRGQSRSTRRDPQNFEISQQARDAVAILRAAGENSACIFGSSSGAIIGLELARSHPEAVRGLVAHEPPTLRVLPDADKWLAFIGQIYVTALREGTEKAMQEFLPSVVTPESAPDPELYSSDIVPQTHHRHMTTGSSEFGLRCELVPVSNYIPDVAAIKKSGVKVVMAIGKDTLEANAFYGRTVPILAEKLGCETATFPGHHGSYLVNPRQWAATLREVLRKI